MSENTSTKTNSVVTEAPASWNTKYVTPDGEAQKRSGHASPSSTINIYGGGSNLDIG